MLGARRETTSAFVALLLFVVSSSSLPAQKEKDVAQYKLTIYSIWGSKESKKEKPPKELEKFLEELKKNSQESSFRLAGKPVTETLVEGKQVSVKLPDGYQARWEVARDQDKPVLRQVLINPRKEESVVLLKKSPVISRLAKIRHAEETFVLILEFEKIVH